MKVCKHSDELQSYIEDTSNICGKADRLYIPETVEELSSLFAELSVNKVTTTLSAGGTGTTGGRVPLDGVVVSIEKFDCILNIDVEQKTILLQAGVLLADAESQLNSKGLSLRAQPTEPLAMVGGVVSTCASGAKSFKYGSIRKYVNYLKIILSDGFMLELRRGQVFAAKRKFNFVINGRSFDFNLPKYHMPNIKHSAGYYIEDNMDLIDLFIGQEGTLGVIVEVGLDVQQKPTDFFDCVVFFNTENDAFDFVKAIRSRKETNKDYPSSIEFFDCNSLEFLVSDYPELKDKNCAVYFEQDIELESDADQLIDEYCCLMQTSNALMDDVWLADNDKNREKLRKFRHNLPININEYLREHKTKKMATDIAVPAEAFFTMYKFYQEVAAEADMPYVNFGHIGQDHLHFNFLPQDKQHESHMKEYVLKLINKAVELGGTVSAEHGIGKIKKDYLQIMYGKEHVKQMAIVKKVFDANCILNLDNVFPRSFLS